MTTRHRCARRTARALVIAPLTLAATALSSAFGPLTLAATAPSFLVGAPALAAAAAPEPARGDSPEDASSVELGELVVTATRTPIAAEDALVPVTVIARDEIERSLATDVAELLRFHAGLDIGRTGGPGQQTSVFIRGTESNHTLVLIDGVRVNPATSGGATLQFLSPGLVERIEIVEGARSSLYGTDAIGGVINVITRRAGGPSFEAAATGGSFDTRQAQLALGDEGETLRYGLAIDWLDTGGTPGPVIGSGAARFATQELAYDNLSANAYAAFALGEGELSLRHWRAGGESEFVDFFGATRRLDFSNAISALELVSPLGEAWRSRLVVSALADEVDVRDSSSDNESDRLTLDWQTDYRLNDTDLLTGGLYYAHEETDVSSFGSDLDSSTDLAAVFGAYQYGGERHQTLLSARYSRHEDFGSEVTWNAEYGYRFGPRWRASAGAGHAFRAPDLFDRFGFGGSPDLAPEVSDQLQAALVFTPAPRHRLALELYANDIDDLIEFDFADFALRNIGEVEIRGAELAYAWRGARWDLGAELVRQRADNVADDVRLLRRAEESFTLRLERRIGEHALGVSVLASGDRADFGGQRLTGYVFADLNARLVLGEHWRLTASIENLLDTEYSLAANFPAPGRGGYAEVGYRWR